MQHIRAAAARNAKPAQAAGKTAAQPARIAPIGRLLRTSVPRLNLKARHFLHQRVNAVAVFVANIVDMAHRDVYLLGA